MKPITNDAVVALRVLNCLSHAGLAPKHRKKVIQVERYLTRILLKLAELGIGSEEEINAYLTHTLDLAAEARNGSVDKCVGCPWAPPGSNGVGAAKS